jgi:signal transduction histidine kinase
MRPVGIERGRSDDAVPPRVDAAVHGADPAQTASAEPADLTRKRPRLVPPAEEAPPAPVPAAESVVHLLAAELHDGVSQQLFAAELDVHELRCTPGLDPEIRQILDRLALRLETGSRELRSALFRMLESEREQEESAPLGDRVRVTVDDFRAREGVTATLRVQGAGPEPSPAAARLLLRTVREGLANVIKHAQATEVLVVLRCGRRWWTAEVHDDGSGDPQAVRDCAAQATSFGLFSLVSDTSRVGGRFWVSEAPGLGGVRLSVSVPVGAPEPPASLDL